MPLIEDVRHFFSDPNEAPPYGYQDHAVTGVGFWLMQGGRFAISTFDRGAEATSCMEASALKAAAIFIGLLTLPLTAIGAALKGVGTQFPIRVENLTSDQIKKTPPHIVDQVYELLKITDGLLRQHHIDYSADGGTLLGAAREKGMVPWDDDGDIFLMYRDKARFLALKEQFKAKGVILQDVGLEAYKLTFDVKTLKEKFGVDEAANLDVFLVDEDEDGKIRPKSDYFKSLFPKEWFLREELQNLRDYPFGPPERGLVLRGPADPMRYLKTYYGQECFEYALQTHSHIQVGPFALPLLNFSKTRYKIVNPTFAEGNLWRRSS